MGLRDQFGCLADLLAYLRSKGYGRGFTCDVFGATEGEAPMRLIPSSVVAKWTGTARQGPAEAR